MKVRLGKSALGRWAEKIFITFLIFIYFYNYNCSVLAYLWATFGQNFRPVAFVLAKKCSLENSVKVRLIVKVRLGESVLGKSKFGNFRNLFSPWPWKLIVSAAHSPTCGLLVPKISRPQHGSFRRYARGNFSVKVRLEFAGSVASVCLKVLDGMQIDCPRTSKRFGNPPLTFPLPYAPISIVYLKKKISSREGTSGPAA